MKNTLLILNGPDLSDLSIHGALCEKITLKDIEDKCKEVCSKLNIELDFRQTDDEREFLDFLHKDSKRFNAVIINPAGYSHALSTELSRHQLAIKTLLHQKKPVTEVHIANIFKQGSDITKPLQVPEGEMGFVSGLGIYSYVLAINAISKKLNKGA
jgi:3-dehydroquinate dehydratase II